MQRCWLLTLALHSVVQPGKTVEGTGAARTAWEFVCLALQLEPSCLAEALPGAQGETWAELEPEVQLEK